MEEKELIKSVRNENRYKKELIFIYTIYFLAALFFAYFCSVEYDFKNFGSLFMHFLEFFSIPFSLINHIILLSIYNHASIIITSKKTICAYGIKRQVIIPNDSITSVTMSRLLNSIDIICAGKFYKISYIENGEDICGVINNIIAKRIVSDTTSTSTLISENTDRDISIEMKKYKSLLDDGLITQEEYDSKKRQLLNL